MKTDVLSIDEIKARLTVPDVWQMLQLPLPASAATVPAAQSVQFEAPDLEVVPGGHLLQLLLLAGDTVPAGQVVQVAAPG